MPSSSTAAGDTPPAVSFDERDLYMRVRGEFYEMPALTLTLPQAARLFGIEQARCQCVLKALVRDEVLSTNGSSFVRAMSGRNSM